MRFFKYLFIVFLLLAVTFYFTAGLAIRKLIPYGLEYLHPELAEHGISIKKLDYGDVRMRSFNSFSVNDIVLSFNLEKEIYGKKSFHADYKADAVIIRIVNITDPTIKLSFKDFDLFIETNEDKKDKPFGKFEDANWKGEAPIRLYDLRESGQLIMNRFKELFKNNSVPEKMEFAGVAVLSLNNQILKIRIYTERLDERTYLFFDKSDILVALKSFPDIELSEEEADLISKYPARTLHLLKITRDAKKFSKQERRGQKKFPEDAFRHIYWSYNLTKTFGPEFAEEVTNAHETLPNNTKQEREMDYINNGIGRELAQKTLSYDQLKHEVLTNPNIILSPDLLK